MGAVYSTIRPICLNIRAFLQTLSSLNAEFNTTLARINTPPGLPVPNPTSSFWQEDPPFPDLVDIKSSTLPTTTDIVIIGSGITGASIAWTLLKELSRLGIKRRIVMLEARKICSGATGRNGGHIKTEPDGEFSMHKRRFGVERAKKIVTFKARHVQMLIELVKSEDLDIAECREVETVDLNIDEETFRKRKEYVADLAKYLPDLAKDYKIWEAAEARKQFSTGPHVIGAVSFPSGALFPYRLVTSLLSKLLTINSLFSIETSTPCTQITVASSSAQPYIVQTPRGAISTSHVIHATNAHAAHLIPGITGKLFPLRGHCSAQRPSLSLPAPSPIGSRSWSFMYREGYDYVTQLPRPGSEGIIIAGGGHYASEARGLDLLGDPSDAELNFHSSVHLQGVLPMVFGENWGPDAPEGRIRNIWSGSLGFTADAMPYVGRLPCSLTGRKITPTRSKAEGKDVPVPDQPGEWVSAGYCGDGMVSAWQCGVAVALMVLGREDVDEKEPRPGAVEGRVADWLPQEYLISEKRVKESSVVELLDFI